MQVNQTRPQTIVKQSRFLSATAFRRGERDAAAEHVGEPAALALVEQYQNDHADAGEHQQHVEEGDHGSSIRCSA